MTKSKRFEPIKDIASASADELSRAMVDAAKRVAEFERQFEQLRGYREDYLKKSGGGGAIDAVSLHNFRSFLDRLAEALRQQSEKLEIARCEYEERRAAWSAKRVEAESLERAIGRFRQDERRDTERREQRDGDDAAQRIALATHAAGRR